MKWGSAQALARAVLYEGYLLYPYRRSGLKNQKRWAIGTLYPPSYAPSIGERSALRAEVMARGSSPRISMAIAFLQWVERTDPDCEPWLEGVERTVEVDALPPLVDGKASVSGRFSFAPESWDDGASRYASARVEGEWVLEARSIGEEVFRITATISNAFAPPAPLDSRAAELASLISAHVLLACENGAFMSLLDPAPELAALATDCHNDGVFPVLVGEPGRDDRMLASPIHLYDHPAIAPESAGDFFDATEIDEMLALRVQTMTDAEKREARHTDPRAAALIDRTEALSDPERLALHGTQRVAPLPSPKSGDRVRLRPRPGRDIFDIALAGEMATVVSTEVDFEGRRYCTVTIDGDPGRDLGETGQPGHRFFFDLDEVERLP